MPKKSAGLSKQEKAEIARINRLFSDASLREHIREVNSLFEPKKRKVKKKKVSSGVVRTKKKPKKVVTTRAKKSTRTRKSSK